MVYVTRHRNWLDFTVGIEVDLTSAQGWKLTWCLCGGIDLDLILEWGSKLHNFSSGVEINLIFVWGIEVDWVFVFMSKVTLSSCGGSKFDVCGPKFTLFWVWWSIHLFFGGVGVVEIVSASDAGRKYRGVSASVEIDLVVVWNVDIDLISVCRMELDMISVQRSELICFVSGDQTWFGFIIWIKVFLDFVWFSTANWYGVLTDRCVCYVLEDYSVTVDKVAQWFIIGFKRTKEVQGSNSS